MMDIRDNSLDQGEIEVTVKEAVTSILGKSTFLHNKVDGWIAKIMETCLKRLATSAKQYKYVVTCNVMQNAGKCLAPKSTTLLSLGPALGAFEDSQQLGTFFGFQSLLTFRGRNVRSERPVLGHENGRLHDNRLAERSHTVHRLRVLGGCLNGTWKVKRVSVSTLRSCIIQTLFELRP